MNFISRSTIPLPQGQVHDIVANFLLFYGVYFCNLLFILSQVAGYAVGGGHVLHMVCDLTIAADNAIFGQTGPKVLIPYLLLFFKLSFSLCAKTNQAWYGSQ